MDESYCLQDLRDLIGQQQCGKLKAALLEANVSEIKKVWLEIADKTRRDPQKYKKLMEVLKGYEAMSWVVSMLETTFGKTALSVPQFTPLTEFFFGLPLDRLHVAFFG